MGENPEEEPGSQGINSDGWVFGRHVRYSNPRIPCRQDGVGFLTCVCTPPQYLRMRIALIVITCLGLLGGCSTAPREAAPIQIERPPPMAPIEPPAIRRAALQDVLQKGAGRFFARMPVAPHRVGNRLIGHRVLTLYAEAEAHPAGVHVGDVVTAVNGLPIARPEQFMRVWSQLARAESIAVDVLRDQQPVRIVYDIVD